MMAGFGEQRAIGQMSSTNSLELHTKCISTLCAKDHPKPVRVNWMVACGAFASAIYPDWVNCCHPCVGWSTSGESFTRDTRSLTN